VQHFLKLAGDVCPHEVVGLSPNAEAAFASYPWPGNIRELRNVILGCVIGCEGPQIDWEVLEKHWPRGIKDFHRSDTDSAPAGEEVPARWDDTPVFTGTLKEVRSRYQEVVDRRYLAWLLRKCGGNKSQMAREAGVNRKTIDRMLKRHEDLLFDGVKVLDTEHSPGAPCPGWLKACQGEEEGLSRIKICHGDLLKADVEALVNPVNCAGLMGSGLALKFRERWPDVFKSYQRVCKSGDLALGQVFAVPIEDSRHIVHFPTKRYYYESSCLEDIEAGLQSLVQAVRDLKITSIAIPALGCGRGRLEWTKVRSLIIDALTALPEVRALLYCPTHDGEPRTLVPA